MSPSHALDRQPPTSRAVAQVQLNHFVPDMTCCSHVVFLSTTFVLFHLGGLDLFWFSFASSYSWMFTKATTHQHFSVDTDRLTCPWFCIPEPERLQTSKLQFVTSPRLCEIAFATAANTSPYRVVYNKRWFLRGFTRWRHLTQLASQRQTRRSLPRCPENSECTSHLNLGPSGDLSLHVAPEWDTAGSGRSSRFRPMRNTEARVAPTR